MKRATWLSIVPFALFGGIILILYLGLHPNSGGVSKFARHVGDPVPRTDLPVLDGGAAHFKPASWRGRPYLINFFASWCIDCKVEHEELMTLNESQIPIIGIAFKDHPAKTKAYLDQDGNPFASVALDEKGQAGLDWGLTGVPETFLIDAEGIIQWHHIGGLTDQIVTDELMPAWEGLKHDGPSD